MGGLSTVETSPGPPWPNDFYSSLAPANVIIVPANGTASVVYVTSMGEELEIQSVSADLDCQLSGSDVAVECNLLDASGLLLAKVRTGAAITAGQFGQVTFAPELADSSTFPPPPSVSEIQTGLWTANPSDGQQVQVTALEAAAIVTQVRILVGGPVDFGFRIGPVAASRMPQA